MKKNVVIIGLSLVLILLVGVNLTKAQSPAAESILVCVHQTTGNMQVVASPGDCFNTGTLLTLYTQDGTDSRLAALEARVAATEGENKALSLQVDGLEYLLGHFTRSGNEITISGANLNIVNGEGLTATTNGLGNLVIGYNERRDKSGSYDDRSGSHMLVVGSQNNFSSYGGIVAGLWNYSSGDFASVTGGIYNTASGLYSSVSSGYLNQASGEGSSINGGEMNEASGLYSSVSGGERNEASGDSSSVSGGWDNTASGDGSSVSGGWDNTASGDGSSVSGGWANFAMGVGSSVNGGRDNQAIGWYSSVSGGRDNTASGRVSSVSGGEINEASGDGSSVSGGRNNTARGKVSSASGGWANFAIGDGSSISGGRNNTASGDDSSIKGGWFRLPPYIYDWVASLLFEASNSPLFP